MFRIIQIVLIGALCAGIFALLYGNTTPVTVSFFGSEIAAGSLGGFLLLSFFIGLLLSSLGALLLGIKQSLHTRRVTNREQRMQRAWTAFSDAQLASLLGDNEAARSGYEKILRHVPEADAALAPLNALGSTDAALIPESGSALIDFLHAQQAERERSFVRATERYSAAYEHTKLPALLRFARDAAIKAELFDKAIALHKRLAAEAKLAESDIEVEAQLAARELSSIPEERGSKLRELVRRYPSSGMLVEELAALEDASGKPDQAALLLGRVARQHPNAERIAAFEKQLVRPSLERALSVIEQNTKGDASQTFVPTKLAILIHHRAISAATELWASVTDKSSERMQRLGAALAILTENKDAAIESLSAATSADSLAALSTEPEQHNKKVVGLAPQFSTP